MEKRAVLQRMINKGMPIRIKKILLLALKIGIGGSIAYYIAELLHLQFASSAGIVTLLTLQQTKWDTLKLSVRRIITFFATFLVCLFLCYAIRTPWFDYGIYLFLLVFFCECWGWRAAISVNAVTAAHFLSTQDFSAEMLLNELLIVLIGIVVAIILNLFHINETHEAHMIHGMREVEQRMRDILKEMAGYLRHQIMGRDVWRDIHNLREDLFKYVDEAQEYQSNTFVSHPEYYVNYFEMRESQCMVLHNLHAEMRRLRNLPKQAEMVADFMDYISNCVTEKNDPQKQINELEHILSEMKNSPLPESREEFESRAMLYHVLMDLEDLLIEKKRFVSSINAKQYEIYWMNEKKNKKVKKLT